MMSRDWRLRRKVVWGSGAVVAILASSLLFAGCGRGREGRGPVTLVLDSLTGASGATPDEFGTVLASDVITLVTVDDARVPTVYEDHGEASFHLVMKDTAAVVSPNNAVTLTRFHVTFVRADGRNTPGVDVPYPFDGAATVTVSDQGSIAFTIVRASAKSEAPLLALAGNGGSQFISAIAQVTFYGTDATGNSVSVTGQINVTFADWGDPS